MDYKHTKPSYTTAKLKTHQVSQEYSNKEKAGAKCSWDAGLQHVSVFMENKNIYWSRASFNSVNNNYY